MRKTDIGANREEMSAISVLLASHSFFFLKENQASFGHFFVAIDFRLIHALVSVSGFLQNLSRKSYLKFKQAKSSISSLRSGFCFVNGHNGFENVIKT